jgi:transcription antitermination factor NusG
MSAAAAIKVVNGLSVRPAPPLRQDLQRSEWNRMPDVSDRIAVARVIPAREYRAGTELVLRGLRPWLPECVVVKSYARQGASTYKGPLFPGYLFVVLCPLWWEAESAPSVIDVLKRDERTPLILRRDDVQELCHLLAADGGILTIEVNAKRRRFASGDRVRIVGGPFEGWEGVYKSKAKDRLKILLDLFGRANETFISEALVEPA